MCRGGRRERRPAPGDNPSHRATARLAGRYRRRCSALSLSAPGETANKKWAAGPLHDLVLLSDPMDFFVAPYIGKSRLLARACAPLEAQKGRDAAGFPGFFLVAG